MLPTVSWTLDKAHFDTVLIRQYFVWDGQLVFMTEWYRYTSCELMNKNGNHLTASMCNSLLDEQECIPPFLFTQCFVLKVAQQPVMQTLLGKGLFLLVAPTVLPTVSWTLDKAHFDIVLIG